MASGSANLPNIPGFLKTLRCSFLNVRNSPSFFLELASSLVLVRGLSSSSKAVDRQKQSSVTVSYRINRRGSARKTASSVVQNVHSGSPVVGFLKTHGFSDSQIGKLITRFPRLVSRDSDQTLLPKVEFFNSIGITGPAFARILTQVPKILWRSINEGLLPCYDFIKSVVLSEDRAIASLRRAPRMFMCNVKTSIAPRIESLTNSGVSLPVLSYLVSCHPNILLLAKFKFEKHVGKVLAMGFNPRNSEFVHALRLFAGTSESTRECKRAVFGRFGWSEDEIMAALRANPTCLLSSEQRTSEMLEFLMNKMGYQREAIARAPMILSYSLNKRIIPRCSVVQVLQSEGLLNEDICLNSIFIPPEKAFLARFVIKYQEQAPQLLNLYKSKLGVRE